MYFFLPFFLLIWYITLIDCYILHHPSTPKINPTRSCCEQIKCLWRKKYFSIIKFSNIHKKRKINNLQIIIILTNPNQLFYHRFFLKLFKFDHLFFNYDENKFFRFIHSYFYAIFLPFPISTTSHPLLSLSMAMGYAHTFLVNLFTIFLLFSPPLWQLTVCFMYLIFCYCFVSLLCSLDSMYK